MGFKQKSDIGVQGKSKIRIFKPHSGMSILRRIVFDEGKYSKNPTFSPICVLKRQYPFFISLLCSMGTMAQTPIANRVKAVAKRLPGQAQIVAKYTDNRRHCLYYTLRDRLLRYDVRTNRREEVTFSSRPYASIIATWMSDDKNTFFIAIDKKGMVPSYLENGQELWMYDSKTRKTKFIGEGFSISHKHNRITIKRASRCIYPSAAQSQQHWMIRDHQFDNEGTPLGKSEEYKMR